MRSIKFKVWDTVDNEMTDWEEIRILPNEKLLIDVFEGDVERYKYLQFTGHKDCDGKEIFDGDILGDWNECDGQMVLSNEVVYFDETLGSWMLDHSLKKDHSFATSLFENLNDFAYKVIGNIYENPDLVMVASEADA